MPKIHLIKHNHSVDGMGVSKTRFASADREAIVEWVCKKVPGHHWGDLRKGKNSESYMYDTFYIEEVPLFDAEELRAADEAAERAKALEAEIKTLQAELDAARQVAI